MTDADAIRIMRRHVEGLFPKECPNCHRRYANLQAYILGTEPLGAPISYDAEMGDWTPKSPLGTAALANCECGNTLMLASEGLPLLQMWRLLQWAKVETRRRSLTYQQLLDYARGEIRRQVLAETKAKKQSGPGAGAD